MTTPETPAAGAIAPAATPSSALVPAAAPASAAPNVGEPDWLNGRIAQAKASAEAALLKTLGVESVDDARKAVVAAKAKDDAEKTAETRAAELKARLDGETLKSTEQSRVIAEYAARQMVGLTAEQKTAVEAIAGSDAAAQLRAIAALQPTWAKATPAAVVTTTITPPAVVQAIDTAPGHTAPAGGVAGSPPNNRAIYEDARKTNPFAAAEHGLRHSDDVYKPRP